MNIQMSLRLGAMCVVLLTCHAASAANVWAFNDDRENPVDFHDPAIWRPTRSAMIGSGDTPRIIGPGEIVMGRDFTTTCNFEMWSTNAYRTSTFRLTNGTYTTSADFNVGTQNDTISGVYTGKVHITGGTVKLTGSSKAFTVGRKSCSAFCEVSGTGTIDLSSGATLCINPTWSSGSPVADFRLKTGGTLIGKAYVDQGSSSYVSKFVYDGGTHRAASTDLLVANHKNFIYVDKGGARIDTAGYEVTIGYKLQKVDDDAGALVKLGDGTLTLTGDNSYCGGTVVSNGTLVANSAASLPGYATAGKVRVCSGATLTLGTGWTAAEKSALRAAIVVEEGGNFGDPQAFAATTADIVDDNSYVNEDGGLKTGSFGLTLGGANDFGGKFTVKEGALAAAFGQGLNANDNLVLSGGTYAGWNGVCNVTLGAGGGQVRLTPGTTSGFSALSVATTVTIGGNADAPVTFGGDFFAPGKLLLNDTSAKHPLTFANRLDVNGGTMGLSVVKSTATAPVTFARGIVNANQGGALSTAAGLVTKDGAGTVILSGTNVLNKIDVANGTLTLAPGSTNAFVELRNSAIDSTSSKIVIDGATLVASSLDLGYNWSSQWGGLVITNEANVKLGELRPHLGKVQQFGGTVDATTFVLTDNELGIGDRTAEYRLYDGVLRASVFQVAAAPEKTNNNGSFYQTGGDVQCGNSDVEFGTTAANAGYGYLSGGRFAMSDKGPDGKNKSFLIGNYGRGYFEVSGSGVLEVPFVFLAGWNANSTTSSGELQLKRGGRIRAARIASFAKGCKSTVLFDGGTFELRSTANLAIEPNQFVNLSNLWMSANGFVFDTTNANVTAVQPILTKPGAVAPAYDVAGWQTATAFVKRGTGTLTLSGTNTYPCATAVEAGTLKLATAARLPGDSLVRVSAGATLDFNGNAAAVKLLGGAGTVNGDVTVSNDFAVAGADLLAGKAMSVNGTVTFAEGAVIDVRGVDLPTFGRIKTLLTATGGIVGTPTLRINGETIVGGTSWHLVAKGTQLRLSSHYGTFMIIR